MHQAIGVRMEIAKKRRTTVSQALVHGNQRGGINFEMLIWIDRYICSQFNRGNASAIPYDKPATFPVSSLVGPMQQLRVMLP